MHKVLTKFSDACLFVDSGEISVLSLKSFVTPCDKNSTIKIRVNALYGLLRIKISLLRA